MALDGSVTRAKRGATPLLLTAAALTSGSLSSCRQVIDDFRVKTADGHDGGGVHDAGNALCHQTGYPPPPRTGKSSPDDSVGFVVALSTTDAGDHGSSDARVGFNIDDTCTTSVDTSSCAPVPVYPTQVTLDGPDGIDNSLGQVASIFYQGLVTLGLQRDEGAGNNAYLLVVSGYNGEPDDPEVSVAMLSGTTQNADGSGAKPKGDGSDVWKVFADWVTDAASRVPKHFAERAYVSDDVLVAEFSELSLSGAPDEPATYGNVFTGQVKQLSDGYHLENGMRAGRWAIPAVLAFLAYNDKMTQKWPTPADCSFPLPSADPQADYQVHKRNACASADVRIEGDGRQGVCDALSIGMAIEGTPAQLGPVVDLHVQGLCVFDNCSSISEGVADAAQ